MSMLLRHMSSSVNLRCDVECWRHYFSDSQRFLGDGGGTISGYVEIRRTKYNTYIWHINLSLYCFMRKSVRCHRFQPLIFSNSAYSTNYDIYYLAGISNDIHFYRILDSILGVYVFNKKQVDFFYSNKAAFQLKF